MVAYAFNLRAWEIEAEGSLSIQGHPGLYTGFQGSQNHTKRTLSGEKKPKTTKQLLSPKGGRRETILASCHLTFTSMSPYTIIKVT